MQVSVICPTFFRTNLTDREGKVAHFAGRFLCAVHYGQMAKAAAQMARRD